MKKLTLLALFTASILSSTALAITQNVQLNLSNIHLRGQDSLSIKKLLNNQIGARTLSGWKLKNIIVSAKSKQSKGELSLKVGQQESLSKIVPGTPENFQEPHLGFSKIHLHAPNTYRGQAQKSIKLLSSGNIKLKQATLKLHKNVQYDHQNLNLRNLKKMAEFKAAKVIGSSKTIYPASKVKGVILQGTKRKVDIDQVKIVYRDGQVIFLEELSGKLKEGNKKIFALKAKLAKPIKMIIVSATTKSLFGSRGKLAVLLAH